eukprot:COSAG02_NODE_1558_length_11928_cov_4.044974_9_plen_109_part_00
MLPVMLVSMLFAMNTHELCFWLYPYLTLHRREAAGKGYPERYDQNYWAAGVAWCSDQPVALILARTGTRDRDYQSLACHVADSLRSHQCPLANREQHQAAHTKHKPPP